MTITTAVSAERRDFLRAVLLVTASVLCFSLLDAGAKYLSRELPVLQIVWMRYLVNFCFALLVSAPWRDARYLKTRHLKLQILRSILLFCSTAFNFVALQHLQLAQTVSILFTAPLLVALLSVFVLGETVGPRRWGAILVGLCGILIVTRPGSDAFQWPALLSVGSAICIAIYNIVTRKIAGSDSARTSQVYVTLIACVALTPLMPGTWQAPSGPMIWVLLFAIGFFGWIGHWLLTAAHDYAPASHIAPFMYSQIVWMVALGYIVFRDVPDFWTAVGALIVVASGLYLLRRERVVREQT